MNLDIKDIIKDVDGVPHRRGDEPFYGFELDLYKGSSPQAWG